jgi:hypothetical protein
LCGRARCCLHRPTSFVIAVVGLADGIPTGIICVEEHTPKINIKLYPLLTPPDKATREESFFPGAMHPQNFVHISEHAHPAAPLPSDIPLFLLPPASLYLYLPVPLLSFVPPCRRAHPPRPRPPTFCLHAVASLYNQQMKFVTRFSIAMPLPLSSRRVRTGVPSPRLPPIRLLTTTKMGT